MQCPVAGAVLENAHVTSPPFACWRPSGWKLLEHQPLVAKKCQNQGMGQSMGWQVFSNSRNDKAPKNQGFVV